MKISYQILCKNETTSLKKLVNQLLDNIDQDDEINICIDSTSTNQNTREILKQYGEYTNINTFERKIDHTIHNQKNWLASKASGDYLFYLDADEVLNPSFFSIVKKLISTNPKIDVYFLPRTNIVEGLTEEYRVSRGWKVDDKGRINWPDVQDRLFKNNGQIKYNEIPHGRLINYSEYAVLPLEDLYAIYHKKSIDKQTSDNRWHDNKERELGLR